jgi:hypothetical protein
MFDDFLISGSLQETVVEVDPEEVNLRIPRRWAKMGVINHNEIMTG